MKQKITWKSNLLLAGDPELGNRKNKEKEAFKCITAENFQHLDDRHVQLAE